MKHFRFLLIIISFLGFQNLLFAQNYQKEILHFQRELNQEFKNPKESPLEAKDFKNFTALKFFPIDSNFRVKARFVLNKNPETFEMATNTKRKPVYIKYGDAYFTINETECHLEIYQNQNLIKKPQYKDYLFVPFGDLTNDKQSYSGGRYIDLRIPKDDNFIIIDFNKAYNPYCAYSHRYSCPLIPYANILPVEIKAGVKKFQ